MDDTNYYTRMAKYARTKSPPIDLDLKKQFEKKTSRTLLSEVAEMADLARQSIIARDTAFVVLHEKGISWTRMAAVTAISRQQVMRIVRFHEAKENIPERTTTDDSD
ncbi:MAG: hypothetical protein ACYDHP_12810 [Ferrimicrobium sp.]